MTNGNISASSPISRRLFVDTSRPGVGPSDRSTFISGSVNPRLITDTSSEGVLDLSKFRRAGGRNSFISMQEAQRLAAKIRESKAAQAELNKARLAANLQPVAEVASIPASFEPNLSPQVRAIQQAEAFGRAGFEGARQQILSQQQAALARQAIQAQNLASQAQVIVSNLETKRNSLETERERLQRLADKQLLSRPQANRFKGEVEAFNKEVQRAQEVVSKANEANATVQAAQTALKNAGVKTTTISTTPSAMLSAQPKRQAFGVEGFNPVREFQSGQEFGEQEILEAGQFVFERTGLKKSPIAETVKLVGKPALEAAKIPGGVLLGGVNVLTVGLGKAIETAATAIPEFDVGIPTSGRAQQLIIGAKETPFVRGLLAPIETRTTRGQPEFGFSKTGAIEALTILSLPTILKKGIGRIVKGTVVGEVIRVEPTKTSVRILDEGLAKVKSTGTVFLTKVRENILGKTSIEAGVVQPFTSKFRVQSGKILPLDIRLEPSTRRAFAEIQLSEPQPLIEVTSKSAAATAKAKIEPVVSKAVGKIKTTNLIEPGKIVLGKKIEPFGITTVSRTLRPEIFESISEKGFRESSRQTGVFGQSISQERAGSGKFTTTSDIKITPTVKGVRTKGSFELNTQAEFAALKKQPSLFVSSKAKGVVSGLKAPEEFVKATKPPNVSPKGARGKLQVFFEKQRALQIAEDFRNIQQSLAGEFIKIGKSVGKSKAIEDTEISLTGGNIVGSSLSFLRPRGRTIFLDEEVQRVSEGVARLSGLKGSGLQLLKPLERIASVTGKSFSLSPKNIFALKAVSKVGVGLKTSLAVFPKTAISSRLADLSVPRPRTTGKTVSVVGPINIPISTSFIVGTPTPTPFILPELPEFFPFGSASLKGAGPGFEVFVKRRGKFRRVSPFALTKESALGLGSSIVRETAARTFKIVPTQITGKKLAGFEGFVAPQEFRAPKGKSRLPVGSFVEKAKFAIREPGELREITAKGLAKINRKKIFGNLRSAF